MDTNDMSTSKIIDDTREKLVIEWRLKDFVKSLKEEDYIYRSRPFSFAGHSWYIEMYPNGQKTVKFKGYISMFLTRTSFGSAIEIKYSLDFKTLSGKSHFKMDYTHSFDKAEVRFGSNNFLKMSELLEKKCDLLPSDVLTVICSLEKQKPTYTETNEKLLNDFKALMLSGEHSDTTVKVKDEELRLHRSILASRNLFFHAMFECEMKEKATGIVSIEDCEPKIFRSFIHFVYTGKVDELSSENVCELYYVADKYRENQLKNECLQFMTNAPSVDNIVNFIILALKHDEKELLEKVTNFFCRKAKVIIRSVKWQNFIKNYPMEANELFIKALDRFDDDDDDSDENDEDE